MTIYADYGIKTYNTKKFKCPLYPQKQTYAVQNGKSALPPKADMCSAIADVCFGPIADSCTATNQHLFDHLAGAERLS